MLLAGTLMARAEAEAEAESERAAPGYGALDPRGQEKQQP